MVVQATTFPYEKTRTKVEMVALDNCQLVLFLVLCILAQSTICTMISEQSDCSLHHANLETHFRYEEEADYVFDVTLHHVP